MLMNMMNEEYDDAIPWLHEVLSARSRHQPTWKLATLSKPTRLVIHLFTIHLNYTMKKHIQRTRRWILYNAVGKRNRKIWRESFSQVSFWDMLWPKKSRSCNRAYLCQYMSQVYASNALSGGARNFLYWDQKKIKSIIYKRSKTTNVLLKKKLQMYSTLTHNLKLFFKFVYF